MRIFHLSNDDLVRRNSFKPAQINLANHKQWFAQKLNDPLALILVAEDKSHFVGQVRFEMSALDQKNIIGISLAPAYRGQGLGPVLITKGLKYVKKMRPEIKKIMAYIKIGNIASIKTFEKAGFRFDRELKVDKDRALRYICVLDHFKGENDIESN